jgi:hypothetical protein
MAYQLTRRAHNAAPYSDRSAKLGKPIENLRDALIAARFSGDAEVTVTDTVGGEWARVHVVSEYHSWRGVKREPHIVMELPPAWADSLLRG